MRPTACSQTRGQRAPNPRLCYTTFMELAPEDRFEFRRGEGSTLVIACGALGREIVEAIELNRIAGLDVTCLPAIWHNTPEKIPEGVREKIKAAQGKYDRILVAYGDCGTGGLLDQVLTEEGVERIEGPHCYAFFSGNAVFDKTAMDEDLTAFFLTDYLVRQFEALVIRGILAIGTGEGGAWIAATLAVALLGCAALILSGLTARQPKDWP